MLTDQDLARRHALQERQRVEPMEAEFLRRYGVREFRNAHRNTLALLKSSGATPEAIRRVMKRVAPWGHVSDGPFDHGRIFGRDGDPLILVGHPYGLWPGRQADLDAIRSLGLAVEVNGPEASFYGFGTLQVLVFSRHHTLPKPLLRLLTRPATAPARPESN